MRNRSSVLPCRTNAAVVPEKYRSASCAAHPGNQAGNSGRRAARSGDMSSWTQHLTQVSFENGRRLFELVSETGQMLQLAHRFFGLSHAVGGRIDRGAG